MRVGLAQLHRLGAALAVCCILPAGASAATIFVNDLTDAVTVTDPSASGRLTPCTPSGEGCSFSINAPAGTATATVTYNGVPTSIAGSVLMLDVGSIAISDIILFSDFTTNNGAVTATFWQFTSDSETPLIHASGPPTLVEDGTPQPTFVITYLSAAGGPLGSDTINVQSDVSDVPEPAPSLTALMGLAMLGVALVRRRAVARIC